MLDIKDIHTAVDEKKILKGVSLHVKKGEVVVIMGPNGSGKSTLSNVIMGNPKYISQGSITFNGKEISRMEPDERSKEGIFMSFQHPYEITGVTINNFLRAIVESHKGKMKLKEYKDYVHKALDRLKIDRELLSRYVNVGFSGGEKKRLEMVQMVLLKPKLAILDETDSGLDIDALKVVADAVNASRAPDKSVLIITHYARILNLIKPDRVYILMGGKIVQEGDAKLVDKLEQEGYEWLKENT